MAADEQQCGEDCEGTFHWDSFAFRSADTEQNMECVAASHCRQLP